MAPRIPSEITKGRDTSTDPPVPTARVDEPLEGGPSLWRGTWVLGAATLLLLVISLYGAWRAPHEETQGEAARLLFVHVPSVITAYLALGVGVLGAFWYLIRRSRWADQVSAAAIEIGVLFTGLTLLTGMIWGRLVWSVWWDWNDARMLSTAVLFFLYLGYLVLRRSINDPRVRAMRCAVLGVIASVQVPIVHYSVLWFRTLHQGPTLIRPDVANATMDDAFIQPLGMSVIAFVALFVLLLTVRLHLARTEIFMSYLNHQAGPVGAAIVPPRLGNPA